MGGARINADEIRIVQAFHMMGVSNIEIGEERGHGQSTVAAIVAGRYALPDECRPRRLGGNSNDWPRRVITEQQFAAIYVAADECPPGPGERRGSGSRLRRIANASGEDLRTVSIVLGHAMPGPIPILGRS